MSCRLISSVVYVAYAILTGTVAARVSRALCGGKLCSQIRTAFPGFVSVPTTFPPRPDHPARMPCYQLVVFIRPDASPERLAELFRSVARVVYREQGQFRFLENFGVRPLAWPIRKAGSKFEEVRWVQCLYDCSPAILSTIEGVVKADKDVLQLRHLRYGGYLAEFRGKTSSEKREKMSSAMKLGQLMFDPKRLDEKTIEAAAEQQLR